MDLSSIILEGGNHMTNTNRIRINKEIYNWAIEESKKDFEEIKEKFKNIDAWISQDLLKHGQQLHI